MDVLLQQLIDLKRATIRHTEVETKVRRGQLEVSERRQRIALDAIYQHTMGRALDEGEWARFRAA